MPIGKPSRSCTQHYAFRCNVAVQPWKRCCQTSIRQQGFTYLGILIAIAIIGVFLSETGSIWHTMAQRERERQLLFVGDQFRLAIGRYYNVGAAVGAKGQYPQRLEDLLRDPRLVGVSRYLRKIYYDPMTDNQNWGLLKNTQGRIVGVYSLSDEHPIKQSNFTTADKDFEGKEKYSQWTFIYSPKPVHPTPRLNPGAIKTSSPTSQGLK